MAKQKDLSYNRNPQGKGLKTKIEIEDKDKQLVRDIGKFNLMLFNKYAPLGKAKTPEELSERFSFYFQACMEFDRIPTVEGLALVSGYARSSFFDISQGKFNPQITDIVKWAKDYITAYDAELAIKGKTPSPVYIFRAKNYAGMKDTQDVQITPNINSTVPENVDEIIDKLPERSTASDVE